MNRITLFLGGALAVGMAAAAELPEVSEAALDELGTTIGTPQMTGFIFVEGRYLQPPYTVTRRGNGIFINRIQIEQPVAWRSAAAPGADVPASAAPAKKTLDADGDFEEVKPAAAPAAPAAEPAPADPAAAPAAAEPEKPKTVKSIDDLFDDEPAAKPAPAPAAPPVAAPADPAAPAAEAAPAPAPAPAPAAGVTVLTEEEAKRQKEAVLVNLERVRKGYEVALGRNEVFFIGQRHGRVNGNYGTARTLMAVLPKALRYAQSPLDLLQRLNEGGVYFVDLAICTALFKNKSTFPMLEERLAKIVEAEALEALKRKTPAAW